MPEKKASPIQAALADFYFFDQGGHNLAYQTALQKAFSELKVRAVSYIPKACLVPLPSDTWKKTLHHSDKFLKKVFFRILDYTRLLQNKNIIFLETFSTIDLLLFTFCCLLFTRSDHSVWLLYRDDLSHAPFKMRIRLMLSKMLLFKLTSRFIPLTDSELIAKTLSMKLKTKFSVLPIPHVEILEKKTIPDKHIHLWFPGNPRPEKGILKIAKIAQTQSPAASLFKLHTSKHDAFCSHSNILDITYVPYPLSKKEYWNLMQKADVILLPYNSTIYATRSSGIFVEAIANGKMPVTTANTWMAYELKKFNLVELTVDWNDPRLLANIITLWESPVIRQKLNKMQKTYMQYHCFSSFQAHLNSIDF